MKPLRCALLAWAVLTTASAQPYVVNTIAGKGRLAYAGDGKAATSVNLFSPNRVAFDGSGNLYFTESYYHRVFKVDAAGTLTVVAGNGDSVFAGEGGPTTDAALPNPAGIAVDTAGNLYVGAGSRLCKISGGKLRTIAGTGDDGYSSDRGPAISAKIHTPEGIAVNGAGYIFFSDTQSSVVRRIGTDGIITTVAGTGTSGYSGDGLAATSAQLNGPEGLAFDANGNVYFADQNNHRVRKITPSGIISDFAGTGICGDASDGPATSSPLCYPSGVALDAAGNLIIADAGYIRRVAPDGRLTTIAGNGWLAISGEGEPATGTGISPFYMALDAKRRVCFSDSRNLCIRCLDAAPPPPAATVAVVNAATFLAGAVAPGEIVTIYGAAMGPASLAIASLDASGPPLAAALAGVQIAFDGLAAPLLYVSATQSSAIVPFGVAGKTSTMIQVTYQNKPAGSATLSVAEASPGLFTMASSGSGQGAILNQDWSVNSAARPAARGDILMVFGTGGGITSPPSGDGQFSTGAPANLGLPPTVTIGGADGIVQYAGAAPGMVAGVFQINVQVPDAAPTGNSVPIVVKCGTASSPATVTVALK